MRFYELLNFQHVMGYIFVGWLFMVIFGVGLAYAHFHGPDTEARKKTIVDRYAEGLADRNAPFPLFMILVVGGVVLWGFFYILIHGLAGVKI